MFKYGHRRRCYVTLQRTGCAAQCEVFTAPRLYLSKSAILECIQIPVPQLGLVNWCCYRYYTALW